MNFKRSIILIILCTFLLSGCSKITVPQNSTDVGASKTPTSIPTSSQPSSSITTTPQATENTKIYTQVEIKGIIDIKEPSIQKEAMAGFEDTMKILERDYSFYNLALASINNNIGGLYYSILCDNAPEWESQTPNAIKYINDIPKFSPIYSGISADCIKLIAISQPILDKEHKYSDAANKIRNSDNEVQFLTGLLDLGYYAIDIYADDLLELSRKLEFDTIAHYDDWDQYSDSLRHNITKNPNNKMLDDYLKQYDRQINYSNELKNKEWNLFLFSKVTTQSDNISINLKTYNEEEVTLIH